MRCLECHSEADPVRKSHVEDARLWKKNATEGVTVTLHNIEVLECCDSPIYPCVSPLLELMRENPQATEFSFIEEGRRWEVRQ